MKMTIESTTKIVKADGVDCRVWEGTTARGIPVVALIPRVAVSDDGADLSEFLAELQEQRAPSAAAQAFALYVIL